MPKVLTPLSSFDRYTTVVDLFDDDDFHLKGDRLQDIVFEFRGSNRQVRMYQCVSLSAENLGSCPNPQQQEGAAFPPAHLAEISAAFPAKAMKCIAKKWKGGHLVVLLPQYDGTTSAALTLLNAVHTSTTCSNTLQVLLHGSADALCYAYQLAAECAPRVARVMEDTAREVILATKRLDFLVVLQPLYLLATMCDGLRIAFSHVAAVQFMQYLMGATSIHDIHSVAPLLFTILSSNEVLAVFRGAVQRQQSETCRLLLASLCWLFHTGSTASKIRDTFDFVLASCGSTAAAQSAKVALHRYVQQNAQQLVHSLEVVSCKNERPTILKETMASSQWSLNMSQSRRAQSGSGYIFG